MMGSRSFLLAALLLLICLAQVSSHIGTADDESPMVEVVKGTTTTTSNRRLLTFPDCGGLCKGRCRLHSRPNVCSRACGTCCARCRCVPPGTSGNRELCGTCYTDMTTHGNRPKCP